MGHRIKIQRIPEGTGYSTGLVFGSYDPGCLGVALGSSRDTGVVTISDDALGVYYVDCGEIYKRFRACQTLEEATQLWHSVICEEFAKDRELLLMVPHFARKEGIRIGRRQLQTELKDLLND